MISPKMLLAVTAAAVLIPLPTFAYMQSNNASGASQGDPHAQGNASEVAQELVPANARLVKTLDARHAQMGQAVTAELLDTVHLKNGTDLPKNTELEGKVVQDALNLPGQSKVALKFATAKLPSGQTVPIRAMLVGVYAPRTSNYQGDPAVPEDNVHNIWTPSILQIDQLNALPGVDLHSRVTGRNSGVFVSKKSKDVKIDAGDELQFALGATNGSAAQSAMNSGGGQQ